MAVQTVTAFDSHVELANPPHPPLPVASESSVARAGGREERTQSAAAARLRGSCSTTVVFLRVRSRHPPRKLPSRCTAPGKMPSSLKRPGEDLEGGALPIHEAAGRLFENVGQVGGSRKKHAASTRTGQACDRCKVSARG